MKHKIVFLDEGTIPGVDITPISKLGIYTGFNNTPHDKITENCLDAEIVITNKTPLKTETIAQLPNLKLICVAATGMNNIDLEAARNAGIRNTSSPLVLVLDGDDRLRPAYIEKVRRMLCESSRMVAASSWMQTFGALNAAVCPCGGDVAAFLSRNCCPATHIMRRSVWEMCGGYDESMRSGFEDWEFFLSMLETEPDTSIGIVEEMLIEYRTAPVSSNIKSMDKRLEIMRFIIEKHARTYQKYIAEALLGIEAVSMGRLFKWENEILYALDGEGTISSGAEEFLKNPTYGDGGMAAAVRIVSRSDIGKDRGNEKK